MKKGKSKIKKNKVQQLRKKNIFIRINCKYVRKKMKICTIIKPQNYEKKVIILWKKKVVN